MARADTATMANWKHWERRVLGRVEHGGDRAEAGRSARFLEGLMRNPKHPDLKGCDPDQLAAMAARLNAAAKGA